MGPEPATTSQLLQVFRDPDVSLIVWTSHGTPEGLTRDANMIPVETNFLTLPGARLKYFLATTCFGDAVVCNVGFKNYPGIQVWGAKEAYILAIDVYPHAATELKRMLAVESPVPQTPKCDEALKSTAIPAY